MNELESLHAAYTTLLDQQHFNSLDLDDAVLNRHMPFLQQLAQVGNSGVTVFDMFKRKHVYASYNFSELFGFNLQLIEEEGNAYFNSKIHPDDLVQLMRNGNEMMKFLFTIPPVHRMHYKSINEYRIKNSYGNYIRVIEQHQALELDRQGNVWLSLGIIDISPNQDNYHDVKYKMINFKTGEIVAISGAHNATEKTISKREKEILLLIKDGLLSKEISEKLAISVHTVNTHRQRILEKLHADNSLEAVNYASRLGLLD